MKHIKDVIREIKYPPLIAHMSINGFGVLYIRFKHRARMCRAFMRYQEHFEHPHFRKKVFSARDLRKWEKQNGILGKYEDRWAGFNVPRNVFFSFEKGKFDPLSKDELALVSTINAINPNYVIAGADDYAMSKLVFDHELAHALYYLDKTYRTKVNIILRNIPLKIRTQLYTKLRAYGYASVQYRDELNAYLSQGDEELIPKNTDPKLKEISQKLALLYQQRLTEHGDLFSSFTPIEPI